MKAKQLLVLAALGAAVLSGCVKTVHVKGCTENPLAKEYLETVTYPDGDYTSESHIYAFDTLEVDYRRDQPFPLVVKWDKNAKYSAYTVDVLAEKKGAEPVFTYELGGDADSVLVYNLIPGKEYFYTVSGKTAKGMKPVVKGTLTAEGPLRMIRTETLHNVRDLGGWKTTDGGTLRYGLLYRGGQMNRDKTMSEADIELLKGFLGIKTDVDLRWLDELDNGTPDDPTDDLLYSPLGDDVQYKDFPINLYDLANSDPVVWKANLEYIMDNVIEGNPCYLHCAAGADRTGTTCFLLESVLGVSEEDICKEYELTSFSVYGRRIRTQGVAYALMMKYIYGIEGENLKAKVEKYLTETFGIPMEKIDAFRAAMIE